MYLPPLVRGEDTLAGWKGDGGSIFWKTPDTALYSTYLSTLWVQQNMRNWKLMIGLVSPDGSLPGELPIGSQAAVLVYQAAMVDWLMGLICLLDGMVLMIM